MMPQVLFVVLVAVAAAYFVRRMKVDPWCLLSVVRVLSISSRAFQNLRMSPTAAGLEAYSQPIVVGCPWLPWRSCARRLRNRGGSVLIDRIPAVQDAGSISNSTPTIPTVLLAFTFRFPEESPSTMLEFTICASTRRLTRPNISSLLLFMRRCRSRFASRPLANVLRQWWIVALGALWVCSDLYAGFCCVGGHYISRVRDADRALDPSGIERSVALFLNSSCSAEPGLLVAKHMIKPVKNNCDDLVLRSSNRPRCRDQPR